MLLISELGILPAKNHWKLRPTSKIGGVSNDGSVFSSNPISFGVMNSSIVTVAMLEFKAI